MKNCQGYQQMLKDRLLFSMLQTGLIRRVKGM
jgi:hypothetical protein